MMMSRWREVERILKQARDASNVARDDLYYFLEALSIEDQLIFEKEVANAEAVLCEAYKKLNQIVHRVGKLETSATIRKLRALESKR